jgi:hypothetical protein
LGIPIATQYFTFNLAGGDTFKAIPVDTVVNWFANLPAGLSAATAQAVPANSLTALIKVTGIPTAIPSTLTPVVAISGDRTSSGAPRVVSTSVPSYSISAPTASITPANFTVSGSAGNSVTGGTVTIQLVGLNYFKNTISGTALTATDWISNAPAGITVTGTTNAGTSSITLAIAGTLSATQQRNDQRIEFRIPADQTTSNQPIAITTSDTIKFNITQY